MKEESRKKYHKKKIDTYVSIEDIKRLKAICEKYGFKSIYQLLQYLVHSFLRVADPDNDPIIESIPDEIKEMFGDCSSWEKFNYSPRSHEGMAKWRKPDQRKIKTANDIQ